MQDFYIIKLGGSVITEKDENKFAIREEIIAQTGIEIRQALEKTGFSLIIVHGAGPFGHTNVKNYKINEGVTSKKHKIGLKKTIADCNFLNQVVVKKLSEAGINAVGFDPNKFVVQVEKKIVEFKTEAIEKALEEKKVPVLFGQMVPDKKLSASVLSGDAIVGFLAEKFAPKKIFLGTDVKGIFSKEPKTSADAELIELIDKKNFEEVIKKVEGAKTVDVTEGMKGKLLKLKEQLFNKEVFIFDLTKKGNAFKVLAGKKIEGTLVRF